jgi:adenylylsulfate kinase
MSSSAPVAPKSQNIVWHGETVSRAQREAAMGGKGAVVWLTGLSGSGKSSVARRAEQLLLDQGVHAYVLDGDNVRFGLCRDLGFSPQDRAENIRRVGEVAKLFADACVVVLTAFVSPYRADRDAVRALLPEGAFLEAWVDTPIELCAARDPKGLYEKARQGLIAEFTGVSAPYEEPLRPELRLQTAGQTVDETAAEVIAALRARGLIG